MRRSFGGTGVRRASRNVDRHARASPFGARQLQPAARAVQRLEPRPRVAEADPLRSRDRLADCSAPSSVTAITSMPPARRASMSIRPASTRAARPWRIAFSTIGWSSSAGTRTSSGRVVDREAHAQAIAEPRLLDVEVARDQVDLLRRAGSPAPIRDPACGAGGRSGRRSWCRPCRDPRGPSRRWCSGY